jgi:hypothetical protein
MDPETQRLWNEWADRRVQALLRNERARLEQRLGELEVKILETVAEAFKVNVATSTKFVEEAVEHGIRQSAEHAKKLLTEFHGTVRNVLEGRGVVSGPRETIN